MPRRKFRSGSPDAFRYTGGHTKTLKSGYVLEYCPDHPACNARGYVPQHRLVMERHLGRYLTGRERVHHRPPGVRSDNRWQNLELYESQAAHIAHHHRVEQPTKRYQPAVVAAVRQAAADPAVSLKTAAARIGISHTTVWAILKDHQIPWVSAQHKAPPRTTPKRRPPGYLDAKREAIRKSAMRVGVPQTAEKYGVHRTALNKMLRRWSAQDGWSGEFARRPYSQWRRKPQRGRRGQSVKPSKR